MQIRIYLITLILGITLLVSDTYSSETKQVSGEGEGRPTKYSRTSNKDNPRLPSSTPKLEILVEQPQVPDLYKFPEDIKRINMVLVNGATHLSILVSLEYRGSFPSIIPFPSLSGLESLDIFHSLTIDFTYDTYRINALLPLIKAPNLQKIKFTSFLAEAIMPNINNGVHATADFTHWDLSSSVMDEGWEDIAKKKLEKLLEEKKWKVRIPAKSSINQ